MSRRSRIVARAGAGEVLCEEHRPDGKRYWFLHDGRHVQVSERILRQFEPVGDGLLPGTTQTYRPKGADT